MTRDETIDLLAIFRVNYPKFGNGTEADIETLITLWHKFLEPYPADAVNAIALQHIAESKYQPNIADIMQRIKAVQNLDTPDPNAMFDLLRRAAHNSLYHSAEEFQRLPKICQDFLGSASALRDIGMVDDEILNTVTRGQFLRQAETLVERQRLREGIPEKMRDLLTQGIKTVPMLEETGSADMEAQEG